MKDAELLALIDEILPNLDTSDMKRTRREILLLVKQVVLTTMQRSHWLVIEAAAKIADLNMD